MDPADGIDAGDMADVTNCTAFLSIDSLLEDGTITEDRAQLLKARFKELHDRVLQIYQNDKFLLDRARQLKKDLEVEKQRVERCGEVAQQDDTQIQDLKRQLASAEHDLAIAQERESMLQVEALELERKRQTLTHDVEESIAQEAAKLIPLIEAQRAEIKTLSDDIDKTQNKFDGLKGDREKLIEEQEDVEAKIGETRAEIADAEKEFARVAREPERAGKKLEVTSKALATAAKEHQSIADRVHQQRQKLNGLESETNQLQAQIDTLVGELRKSEEKLKTKMVFRDGARAMMQEQMQRRSHLEKDIKRLDDMTKTTDVALIQERDGITRRHRMKDQGLREFKKIEQGKANLIAEADMIDKRKEMAQRELQQIDTQRAKVAAELAELHREVDVLINNMLKEEISADRCVQDKQQLLTIVREMEGDVAARAGEEQQLRRDAAGLSVKREHLSREASRNAGKAQSAESELKVRGVVLMELCKRHDELRGQLSSVVDHWQRVKRERSAKAHLIQSMTQTMAETQEKIKILDNELEVLRRESQIKDTELRRKEREAHDHRQACKKLRVERSRWSRKLEAARDAEEDLKRQLGKLNGVITTTESAMLRLKQSYEEGVEQRNYTGIQLIDRNDELCILYEKANTQERILKQGMAMLAQRDGDTQRLSVELTGLQREIDTCQRVLPTVRDVEEDLAEVLLQLDEERWRAEVLESDDVDPQNPARWRRLPKPGATGRAAVSGVAKEKLATFGRNATGGEGAATAGGGDDAAATAGLAASTGAGLLDTATGAGAAADGTSGTVASVDGAGGVGGSSAGGQPGAAAKTAASNDLMELSEKEQRLEQRLSQVNERLMEKELVLEEITELANALRQQAAAGRGFTLALAKKVGQYQSGIKARTRRMMATLSELSMVQASAMKLEGDTTEAEVAVADAQARMAGGQAPSDEAERQFMRESRRRAEVRAARVTQKEQEAQMTMMAGATAIGALDGLGGTGLGGTAATTGGGDGSPPRPPPRANAYMAGDDGLMLPKPFGSHAPFKPSVAPNVHRFQRLPQLPELEDDDE